MDVRADLLDRLTMAVPPGRVLVGVDGVDGAGKTTFAAAWVEHLGLAGRPAVHVSLDGFHRPRAERYARGRTSPRGFFEDSYDLAAFRDAVVAPLREGGPVRTAVFDHVSDSRVPGEEVDVRCEGVVVVDGLFLHRDELTDVWDLSVLLVVPFEVTFARMAVRDGCPADPSDPANARYVGGQDVYLASCVPSDRADVVVDNSDPRSPVLLVDRVRLGTLGTGRAEG